ncbi:MAG: glutathione transferase GstA [Gammaproteobacteria bacterium]|nr:glutathione transferase GstA [Gammaproteobacteria bacterium]
MKLYYAPGACSMAPHIALREAGLTFDLEKVDLANKQTASGEDFTKVNPKGYVPALKLDDGQILTEAAVTVQYIADQMPESGLAPKAGTMDRYRMLEWLNLISTEFHKTLGALFNPNITPEWKENQIATFGKRCDFLSQHLDSRQFLMGDQYTIADAYLFTILGWTNYHKVDMSNWPTLTDYMGRIAARPAVVETMKAEGLSK